MSSPATAATSLSSLAPPTLHLDQDPHKRPFDPRATMILLGSLALRADASRLGYRSGYEKAQHLVRNAPKESVLGAFAPAESPNASLGGMATSLMHGFVHGVVNLGVRAQTGVTRTFQGASNGDLSRIRDVFIRYAHYHCTTDEDKNFLKWALLGVRKICEAYPGEEGPLQALVDINRIGINALNSILPEEKPVNFGTEWRLDEIAAFHTKLRDSFTAMQALTQAESSVQTGIAKDEKISLGAKLQISIEGALKTKADQYERTVSLALAAQAARYQTGAAATGATPTAAASAQIAASPASATAAPPLPAGAAASPALPEAAAAAASPALAAAAAGSPQIVTARSLIAGSPLGGAEPAIGSAEKKGGTRGTTATKTGAGIGTG